MPAQPTPPRISGYDFIQPLGTGATASVYRYHQRVPSRDVAIKVSSATLDPRAAARFRNEANYMAELSAHPYILHPRRRRDQHRTWLHRAGIRARRLL